MPHLTAVAEMVRRRGGRGVEGRGRDIGRGGGVVAATRLRRVLLRCWEAGRRKWWACKTID